MAEIRHLEAAVGCDYCCVTDSCNAHFCSDREVKQLSCQFRSLVRAVDDETTHEYSFLDLGCFDFLLGYSGIGHFSLERSEINKKIIILLDCERYNISRLYS